MKKAKKKVVKKEVVKMEKVRKKGRVDESRREETVWGAMGLSDAEGEVLTRRAQAANLLEDTKTGTLERLFPEFDSHQHARIFAYGSMMSESAVKHVIGGFARMMMGDEKKGKGDE